MSLRGGISLIIPLQDEEDSVGALLESVASQTTKPDEVVLVDAGSTDATVPRAHAVALEPRLRVVAAGRVHPGLARNAGVSASTCEWVAFTDGGVVLHAGWLAELAAGAGSGVDVIYGAYDPVCDSYFRQCAAIAYVSAKDRSGTRGPCLASCMMRRDTFTRAGGFPPFRAAEDLIFIHRLSEQGARVVFAPKALVRWQIAGSAAATFRRFASYSYHNLIAGWGRHWHAGTARLYAALAIAIVGATLLVGRGWALPLLPAFFLVRAAKSAYLKKGSFDFATLAPQRVLGTAGILALIDVATTMGFARWIVARARR